MAFWLGRLQVQGLGWHRMHATDSPLSPQLFCFFCSGVSTLTWQGAGIVGYEMESQCARGALGPGIIEASCCDLVNV